MIDVYFFFQKPVVGEFEQTPYYDSLEVAMSVWRLSINNPDYEEVSPVIKGYVEE